MTLTIQDVHKALHEVVASGRKKEDLQALLVHTDDLTELLKSIAQSGMGFDSIQLFGVEIIESKLAQKGTIFKIFKTDDQLPYWSVGIDQWTVPNPEYNKPFVIFADDKDEANVGKEKKIKKKKNSKQKEKKIISTLDDELPFELDEDCENNDGIKKKKKTKKKKKKKNQHSDIRKIQLD